MATNSRIYLLYCDCTRKGSGDKLTIAAGITGGDSDLLSVGRHGIFYDRQGNDRSEEHTSELQSLMRISYAVFCLKKKKEKQQIDTTHTTEPIRTPPQ